MYYPHRVAGVVVGLYANRQDFTDLEPIEADSAEALPFTDPRADPKVAALQQIRVLEQAQLMPRATREFMLLTMEAQATPQQLAQLAGYVRLKAFDNEIAALRAIVRGDA